MKLVLITVAAMILYACSGPQSRLDGAGKNIDWARVKPVNPYNEPRSKQGNPDSYVVWGKRYFVMPSAAGYYEEGIASWYGSKFHGNNTSNGEVYDMYQLSAAHKSLPLPTYVEVTNLNNQRKIILRVNDRGPFHEERIIDLSYAAAVKLDMIKAGTAKVSVRAITSTDSKASIANHEHSPWNDQSHLQGRVFTQVAAFSVLQNAKNLRQELLTKQFKYVQITTEKEKKLYRLRLGPHRSTQQAEQVLARLKQQGYADAKIIVLDKQ